MTFTRRILIAFLGALLAFQSFAQEKKGPQDSVFRLIRADEAMQVKEYDVEYRRVKGHAQFFQNNTRLFCDSASWNLSTNVIDAYGNVRIKQDNTTITSESLTYLADEDLACFRGALVELKDKEGNILRTKHLDYNTKDSLATFEEGGAMKSKEGNVIESLNGNYDSKIKVFVFEEQVHLYMDSIIVKTSRIDYLADSSKAFFGPGTNVWKDHGYIRSDAGWYSREDTLVCFQDRVYGHDDDYEFWCDELYYDRRKSLVELFDNVSILDTSRKVVLVADYLRHEQDSSTTYLLDDPAAIYYGSTDNNGNVDTLFMRADTVIFKAEYKCDIPKEEVEAAKKRRADVGFDALTEYRTKLAVEREKKIEEGLRAAGKLPPLPPQDSTATQAPAADDAAPAAAPAPVDSTAGPDSTKVNIIRAFPNFKMYRNEMQAASDSLVFTDMDSIAILLGRPIMWNTEKNQLTSEVMHLLVKNGDVDRGSMLEDARITSKEAENCYNQIKSTEMMGFFHKNELYRYDALGNVNAIIYMDEDGELTNINVKESKSLTSLIKNGKAQRMLYLEEIKSDAYPIPDLEEDRRKLKGFEWRIEERPASRAAITTKPVPISWRKLFSGNNKPQFRYVDRYFDEYMMKIYEEMRIREQEERIRRLAAEAGGKANSLADSLSLDDISILADSLRVSDSLFFADSLHIDIEKKATADKDKKESVTSSDDTQKVEKKLSAKERRELRRAERKARREARRAERKARREARREARKTAREARNSSKADVVSSRPQPQPQN